MKRIYHPFYKWEEVSAGMWESVSGKELAGHLARAIEFTGNAVLYGSFMLKVIKSWPYSCEHNLTDENINRKAWIGHAATALAIGCPEHITRMAWGRLSQQQQDDANAQAQSAINQWIKTHEEKNTVLHQVMAEQRVFEWNS